MRQQNKRNSHTSRKVAFVTFSSRALTARPRFFAKFVALLESAGGLEVRYRWFEDSVRQDPETIHVGSQQAMREADIFVAEVSRSSTGVGQQIFFAIQKNMPVFLFMQKKFEQKSSFLFLKGTRASNVRFVYYSSLSDLSELFKTKKLRFVARTKLQKFNFVATASVKSALLQESRKRGVSQSELLRRIVEQWIDSNNLG